MERPHDARSGRPRALPARRSDATDRAPYTTTYVFYDDDGRPLAFVALACASIEPWEAFEDCDEVPVLLIEFLAVDRNNQQQGVGSEVMRWIRAKADDMGVGCRFLALYCDRRNTSAQAFYRRQGFFEAPAHAGLWGDETLWLLDLAVPSHEFVLDEIGTSRRDLGR